MTDEQFGTCSKKVRGMAKRSLDLIEAMTEIAEAAQPITGRGVGYKLFTASMINSMSKSNMQRVYRLLKEARERGIIPWGWIVDEGRSLEVRATWKDPGEFARQMGNAYCRDFWDQQPVRVEVWSEKGTVRGVLQPVLDGYGVGFRVMHGFSGATSVHDIAQGDDECPLVALYVGDYDPSGMFMSERDLPDRLKKYGGHHVVFTRIALTKPDLSGLPSFPVSDKKKDPRHDWFVERFGRQCWELDAMDPNDLRDRVRQSIVDLIEPEAWGRCYRNQQAEQKSLRVFLDSWRGAP